MPADRDLTASPAAMVAEAATAPAERQAEVAKALTAMAKEKGTPIVDGDKLVFVYQGVPGDKVSADGVSEVPMQLLGKSGVFVGVEQVPDLDQAIISYMLTVNGRPLHDPWTHYPAMDEGSPVSVFRGANAAAPHELAVETAPAVGQVLDTTFTSAAPGVSRQVWVYLPPHFAPGGSYPVLLMADGQWYFTGSVHLERMLDHMISEGVMPPVVAIGVESDPNTRFAEFILGQPRFAGYDQFVYNEVLPWAQREHQFTLEPGDLIPVGFSNGGGWAYYTSVQHPDLVSKAILQSPVTSGDTPQAPPQTRYYITVGALDQLGLQCATVISNALDLSDNPVQMAKGVGGHDLAMAETQLVEALKWIFQK